MGSHTPWAAGPANCYGNIYVGRLCQISGLGKITKIEQLCNDGWKEPKNLEQERDELLERCKSTGLLAASSLMECSIMAASKLSGLQKRKRLGNAAGTWAMMTSKLHSSVAPAASDHVHPALYQLLRLNGIQSATASGAASCAGTTATAS